MSYVKLHLRLATPLFAGSVDPNVVDEDTPLRPSEVKGVWRWWARAVIGGALYSAGLLHGMEAKDILKVPANKPTHNEVDLISKTVGLNLGLGYAGAESSASCFRLIISASINPGSIRKATSGFIKGSKLQRIQLLTLGKQVKGIQYIDQGEFQLTIDSHIKCNLDRNSITVALGSLYLALTLSCFGKGGRRGLGCVDIVKVNGSYGNLFDSSKQLNERLNDITKITENIVRELDKGRGQEPGPCELPPMPVVSNREITGCVHERGILDRFFVFQVIEVSGKNLLPTLHNFFLRSERARVTKGSVYANDDLREKLSAWVLGLPREQKKTGYLMAGDIDRRASPMFLSIHGSNNDTAYLAVFVSADWPKRLKWQGTGSQKEISINEPDVINASYLALNEFLDYLGKQGIQWRLVWPQ